MVKKAMQNRLLLTTETDRYQNKRGKRQFINLFLIGIFLGIIIAITPAFAETNQSFKIDPIGVHASGEKFNISGTTSIEKCKKVGIEIFPKEFWNYADKFAKDGGDGRIVFNEIASTKERFHPTNIKLIRYNPDGTQAQEELTPSQDHFASVFSVNKSSSGEKRWSVQIEKNENGKPFSPGSYHVNIWDASAQVEKHDFPYPNGWNVITQKIFPSTARVNIWDKNNQKDLQYAEFTIKS